jgi:hypothetical protein
MNTNRLNTAWFSLISSKNIKDQIFDSRGHSLTNLLLLSKQLPPRFRPNSVGEVESNPSIGSSLRRCRSPSRRFLRRWRPPSQSTVHANTRQQVFASSTASGSVQSEVQIMNNPLSWPHMSAVLRR